jgi:hypothetical protein
VEELPKAGCPLDPGAGLGDSLILSHFCEEISSIFSRSSLIVTAVTEQPKNLQDSSKNKALALTCEGRT